MHGNVCGAHVAPPSWVTSKSVACVVCPQEPVTHPVVVLTNVMPYGEQPTGRAPGAVLPLAGVISTCDQCTPPSTVR